MASTSLTVVTATLLGAIITSKGSLGTGQTMTIKASTAQGRLDFKTLHIRVKNEASAGTVSLSLGVGTVYSDKGIGAKTLTTIASAQTRIIGGHDFEGARFNTTAETIVFTQTGTGPTTWEAYQSPGATE
jgi:hypothetical protein